MSVAIAEQPALLHNAVAGRIRVHLPMWSGHDKTYVEQQLKCEPGVERVQANALTSNVLIWFNPDETSEQQLLTSIAGLQVATTGEPDESIERPSALRERKERKVRARITVRGLDRDPQLAKRVVEHLERREGVSAHINQLTGRVLVEFTEHEADLDDLISEVAGLELPELPGEDRPSHPLDSGPLFQSATRMIGATLGLSLLTGRRLFGADLALPGAASATQIATIISLVQSIPPIRYGLRRLFGRTLADLIINVPAIITLTVSGNPLGLTLVASESLRLLTEVVARRQSWQRYEEYEANALSAQPDAVIRAEAGERIPLPGYVIEGTGTAIGRDGMPLAVMPETIVPSGAKLFGGPFSLTLRAEKAFETFTPAPRPAPIRPSLYERYIKVLGPISLLYAVGTAIWTRSLTRTLAALLLVNPRTAAIGLDSADLGASARVLRAGMTVVGTRKGRPIRLPDVVLLDGTRLLTDGLEVLSVLTLTTERESAELLAIMAGISLAAGSPWGNVFRATGATHATEGAFDGKKASASISQVPHTLGPLEDWRAYPQATRLRQRGNYVLALRNEQNGEVLALLALRPRLATGVTELVQTCQRRGVALHVLASGDQLAVQMVAHRAAITVVENDNAVQAIREEQRSGLAIAFISDNAGASAAFDACDLAIGLTNDRYRLSARADVVAPDLEAIAAIVDAGGRRNTTIRDSVGFSILSNIFGLFWGVRGMPGVEQASRAVYITALSSVADGWLRLRGGERPYAISARFVDPHPELWGQRSVAETLRLLQTSEQGLSGQQAAQRQAGVTLQRHQHPIWSAFLEQIRSPLVGILGAGAILSLFLGAVGDVTIISTTILANIAVGVWQEYKANRVSEALQHISSPTAQVLRNGQLKTIAARNVVVGDILELTTGERVAADARVIAAQGLEVDEAALTGESLPVAKSATSEQDMGRIVLEGSDVTSGTARAVVVAVGQQTRLGATVASLAVDEQEQNPLGVRLGRLLRLILPISIGGGGLVIAAGLLRRQPLAAIVTIGASLALTGIPEGLPLLSRVSEAGVARRLASHQAVVRRLSAVEALGRVEVACTDKTGTLTEGKLSVSVVADSQQQQPLHGELAASLHHVLLTAALASPHPDAPDATAHPTDVAVIEAARQAGMNEILHQQHEAELSFDPVRSFHATVVQGRLCLKGAPEALIGRCMQVNVHGKQQHLNDETRTALLERSHQLASQGLRVLMVAEGAATTALDQPRNLTALGFVGISDPLRATVPNAVKRCHEAGVRVVMITGDHPATARAIGRQAGLLDHDARAILTGHELAELHNGDLDQRLEHVTVIARATPLDKLRIIESLQRTGHTVAMTGDGVNDAPALRLANVGVAMGQGGTEVARQTADVVLINDDFSSLVEALVEGRSFWRNIRRALGLLLGGNLGELGLVVGASLIGFGSPLTTSQILAMNAITDILPATAVALQQPEHRSLAGLHREGAVALDKPLRNDIIRRGLATSLPSLAAFCLMLASGASAQARSVAYASVIATQLAQTLDSGRYEGGLTPTVLAAVLGSLAILAATFAIPIVRNFLSLVIPSPFGWLIIAAASITGVLLSRVLTMWGTSMNRVPLIPLGEASVPCSSPVS